jgi:SET domain-containing protein
MTRSVYKTELYRNPKIQIKRSPVQGWGMFANEPLKKYELLEESPIIIVKHEELGNPHNLARYFANLKDGDVFIGLGSGVLYNHSHTPNVTWYVDGVNLTQNYYTLRDIQVGEELFSCYNPNITFEEENDNENIH